MKYFYGLEDQEIYTATDEYEALEEIENDFGEKEMIGLIIVEMKSSRKSGNAYCSKEACFLESGWCGYDCDSYQPRNLKNGICKHHGWGLVRTGRKWKITGKDELEKISGRIK